MPVFWSLPQKFDADRPILSAVEM